MTVFVVTSITCCEKEKDEVGFVVTSVPFHKLFISVSFVRVS